MKIALDLQGGDNAPYAQIDGTLDALKKFKFTPVYFGDKSKIIAYFEKKGADYKAENIIDCNESIENDESPTKAIKRKKDSAIVKGLNFIKENKADCFISSGSTGALLAGSILINGRIKGIDRPALATVIPTLKGGCLLLDLGANASVKPINLNQFAVIGSIYAKDFLRKDSPAVGLLNIGTEEGKGTPVIIEAYELLSENAHINFTGNVEARNVPFGQCDVVVADGFCGNIFLKTLEGTALAIFKELKINLKASITGKLGAVLAMGAFKGVKKAFDYEEYGGAALLGVNSLIIKAHGSANAKTFASAIRQAIIVEKSGIVSKIKAYAAGD